MTPMSIEQSDKLTEKILRLESPGMRKAVLVDAHHFADDHSTVSFIIYDKEPHHGEDALLHERRWAVVVSSGDGKSLSRTGGVVDLYWEDRHGV